MRKAAFSRGLHGASRTTLAALLLATPVAAGAQGFAGTSTVVHGSATITTAGNVQTVSIPTSSPVTTINWTPTDTAIGGGAINFLPTGNTVNYVGATGAQTPYTVLNRILPTDATRTVAFNGTVTSTANTRVWFYSPGGLLIGATASFNVGGLVLTTADPVTDANGNFMATFDQFSVQSPAGSTSAITIAPGASIQALNSAQSNYIVAIAPQISQGGNIAVAGSVALVAAESASFAVDSRGLFNISVTAGTTVAANTFVHTGSTGGPDVAPTDGIQRVYMVAVPKNNAISMAIASGGSIGFAVADAANMDGDQIVLSAGSNIADTGAGNPVVAGRAGIGVATLTVGAGAYTSNTYAVSTDVATVTDPAANITFNSNLAVIAPQATVNAQTGTIAVAGDLVVNANDSVEGVAGTALVAVASGASLLVGGNASALETDGGLTETADDTRTGFGGAATLMDAGTIEIAANALISANGEWNSLNTNTGDNFTYGGTAQVAVTGGLTVGGSLTASAIGDASGSNAALVSGQVYNEALYATGGSASITVNGVSATINASNGIMASGNATGGFDSFGDGGSARAGSALVEADAGGIISVGQTGAIVASANASPSYPAILANNGYGGESTGGTAQVIANAGTITLAGVGGISAVANALGGDAPALMGSGGNATGGTALIATKGVGGRITTDTSGAIDNGYDYTIVQADAQGGEAEGSSSGAGGNGVGGMATLETTGANQSISIDHQAGVTISATGYGSVGAGEGGGEGIGGSAQLLVNGGAITLADTVLVMDASAVGGNDYNIGGAALGGTVRVAATAGGTGSIAVSKGLSAFGSAGGGSSSGGDALGGNIFVDLGNNGVTFAVATNRDSFDASSIPGSRSDGGLGTSGSAGGVRLTDLGTLTLPENIDIGGNTPFYVQAGGSINILAPISSDGTATYLHLWADDLGTGTGSVNLANGALNAPGSQIDIYYNPTSLGTPTDFSAGIAAGTVTAYQLVNNVDALQSVGNFLSQNFALGKNIDASATQGWNAGAGFVPIGNATAAFTGNFDGLAHTINNLYINTPTASYVGLLGNISGNGASAVLVRNVGLTNETITGLNYVGGLVGNIDETIGSAGPITISNSFSTGSITGQFWIGGLIGATTGDFYTTTLALSHSDANITEIPGPNYEGAYEGGIAGTFGGTIIDSFATGLVTGGIEDVFVGGLVGQSYGTITNVYATGAVMLGQDSGEVGGLVGYSASNITRAYAVGSVTVGSGSGDVGGLLGSNAGTATATWASGAVAAVGGTDVGGLVGSNGGTITNSYWDTYSTGQVNGVGYGASSATVTNLVAVTSDPEQDGANNYAFGPYAYGNFANADWVYDNNNTRPVGAWEVPVAQFGVAPINSAHQVQLIDENLGGGYAITQNIDLRGTATTTDIWGPGGFMPLGGEYVDPPFTGTLEGAGHVLSNLTMSPGFGFSATGLVQENDGTISDLGLYNVNIAVVEDGAVGAIAGINAGQITDSFATGTITVAQDANQYGSVGGLVGLNADRPSEGGSIGGGTGSITQSYATVAISGGYAAGGLVGDNEGMIAGSYANGPVSTTVSGASTGGLVGQSYDTSGPTVTDSFWDTQLTGQSVGCGLVGYSGACGGATGLTTAQTLQSASFTGFSIDTLGGQGFPWRQYEGQTTPLLEAFLIPITVQPGSLTMQYDAQEPTIGVTTYGAQPALTFGTPQVSGLISNVAVSYIEYTGGLYSNQLGYDFVRASNPGTLVITQAPLVLSAAPDAKVYDSTTTSAGTVTASGLFGSDSLSNAAQSFTSPNVMGTNGSTLVVNAGYTVNDGNGGNNYAVTLQSAVGTITPAPLVVTYTANPTTSQYGQAIPPLSGSVSTVGLQGTDQVAAVTSGTAIFTTTASAQSNVGQYAITGSGLSANSGNYDFSFVQAPGNATALTISAADLTVDVAADPQSRGYGAANPVLTYTDTGLVNGDTLTGSLATTATQASNVGVYAITQGSLAASSNYVLNFTGSNLTVTPVGLTVTYIANSLTSKYGTTPIGLSGSVGTAGLVNGDTLGSVTSGNAIFTTTATAQSNVGQYAILGSGLSANSGNYNFSFVQAPGNATALTISAADLTVDVTADPQSRSYGAPNPLLTYTDTGLVNGDTLTGSLATTATQASNVGVYAITQGSLAASSNYILNFTGANLTVTPVGLTVTYSANPATSIYGTVPTGLSGTVGAAGLVNGDTLGNVTRGEVSFTTTATAQSNVGSYAITGSGLTANSGNYNFSFVQAPGNATALTIAAAALTVDVAADPQSRIYGAQNPVLTYTDTGLVNGDALTGSLATTATPASNVGIYAITQGTLAASSNYTLNYIGANLTVTPASLTVTYTANPATSIYGNVPSGLSGTAGAAGLVNGDTLGSVTSGAASFTTTATGQSSVGSYAIAGAGLAAASANYNISFVQAPGNASALTIAARPITVTANPEQQQPGAASPTLTYVVTPTSPGLSQGLVNGDQLSGQLTSPVTPTSPAGTYAILQGTLAASANYQLTYVGNVLTVVNGTGPSVAIGNLIEANLLYQMGTPGDQAQQKALRASQAFAIGLYPLQLARTLIDDQLVTLPPPVNEPVTSNGDASLWSPGAP